MIDRPLSPPAAPAAPDDPPPSSAPGSAPRLPPTGGRLTGWSAPGLTLEPVGGSLWPSATAWRHNPRPLDGWGAPPEALAVPLERWLRGLDQPARLEVMLELAQGQSSVSLGLTLLGPSEAVATAALARAAEDLGEALGAWNLFPDPSDLEEPFPPHALSVVVDGPVDPLGHLPSNAPLWQALHSLSRRGEPLALSAEVRLPSLSAGARQQLRDLERRLPILPDAPMFPRFEPSHLQEMRQVAEDLERLRVRAAGLELRLSLHGKPPGRMLREVLEDGLSAQLGRPARLVEGPPVPLQGWRGPERLFGFLMALGLGSPDTEGPPKEGPADEDLAF